LIKHLSFFLVLAQEKHFGRAARACHISQPSLSYAVRKLEQEFGVRLVERGHSYVELTAEGKKVRNWGKRIQRSYDQLRTTLRDAKGEDRG
jgi:molybdate transport system substrate-binding protein